MAKRAGRAFVIEIVSDSKKAQKGFDGFSSSMKGALAGMAAGIGVREIGQFIGDAALAASSVQNLAEGASQIFGEFTGEVLAAAEAANSIGLSDAQYLTQVNYFGNLATAVGLGEEAAFGLSDQFITLGSDFAAFFDAKPEQVIDALASATRGEYDALQRYLPTISAARIEEEKLNVVRDSLVPITDDQARLQAILNIAYDDGGAALGAYAREQDNLSTAVARFDTYKADAIVAFGQGIVDVYDEAAIDVDDVGESLVELGDVSGNVVGNLISDNLQFMTTFRKMKDDTVSVADKMQYGWNQALTSIGLGFPPLYALGDRFKVKNVEMKDTVKASTDDMIRSYGAFASGMATNTGDVIGDIDDVGAAFGDLDYDISQINDDPFGIWDTDSWLQEYGGSLQTLERYWKDVKRAIDNASEAGRNSNSTTGGSYSGGQWRPYAAEPSITIQTGVGDPVAIGREVAGVLERYRQVS